MLAFIESSDFPQAIAQKLEYPRSVVKHVPVNADSDNALSMADLVIYGSFLEEQSFPQVLVKAMSMGKPIIAPDLANIRKHVRFSFLIFLLFGSVS